jgi:HD-GYP domain-containing protein (c-di-GMP phosphodiesterase class II)/DNA-binding CsgD family transcriptional regulator
MGYDNLDGGRIRSAELVACLSLATDLGTGFPLEHALRSCVLATGLGRACGVNDQHLQEVFYVALLKYLGCTVTSHVSAQVLGDELGMATLSENVGAGLAEAERLALLAKAAESPMLLVDNMAQHCELGQLLATELGLPATVSAALGHAFARWNGAGVPMGLGGEAIALSMRIALLTEEVERYARVRGPKAAVEMARHRAGAAYDPELVAVFAAGGEEILAGLDETDCWTAVLDAETGQHHSLSGDAVDRALVAVADFTDMKSPFLIGHSRAVADLAAGAATSAGLPASDSVKLRRAGWLHDLGRVAVSSAIWAKPGPLTSGEWERVRLHPHYTDRVLARSGQLAQLGGTAAMHHERLDGSGYHRGVGGSSQPLSARLLAAADVYVALTEERPHRPAYTPEHAARILGDEARAGRIDGGAAASVLAAAGHPRTRPRGLAPGDLTAREIDVLRALARGLTIREIAQQLFISPKTADNHIQHIYEKLQVSTRAGATLFAMRHGLLEV